MSPRVRRTLAIFCIAAVVFVAFAPGAAAILAHAVLTPLWLVVPVVIVTLVRRRAARSDAQPVALASLVLFRAPPLERPLA